MENIEKNTEKFKQPKHGDKYCKIIKYYINKRYVEHVDAKEETDNRSFLPRFPITHPVKLTTKVMIVYNGSPKCEGIYLNYVIHQGPKLQQDLSNALLRFRTHPISLICDIAEIYIRIEIHPIGWPYQRILQRSLKQSE